MMALGRMLPVVALVLLARLAPAPAETRPGYGGIVIAALLGEPVEIDPVRARSHAELTVASLLFDTLYRAGGKDASGAVRVVPHVAAALPELAQGGLEVRIAIRPGIRFHNGRRLGPDDVIESLRRLARSPSGWLLAPMRAARRHGDSVILELARPVPELALLLTAPAASITPEGTPPTWARAAGSGPFKLERIDRDARKLVLAASATHFAGRPYVSQLELRWFERGDDEPAAYEAGRAHISLRGAVAYAGHSPKYDTAEIMGPATILAYVGFGRAAATARITGSADLRAALSLALDRSGFRGVGTGERVVPALHPVPAALGGPEARELEQRARLREARDALARAAQTVPELAPVVAGQRPAFELVILIDRTRPDDREIAEKVVAALFRLGVPARIEDVPAVELAERVRRGDCDLYIGQLAAPVPAAVPILAAAFAAGGDPFAERELARRELDAATAGRVLAQRLPIVPLFHRAIRVHHRADVRGIRVGDTAELPFADLFVFGKPERSR